MNYFGNQVATNVSRQNIRLIKSTFMNLWISPQFVG